MSCIVFNIYFLVFKQCSGHNCQLFVLLVIKKKKFTVKYFLKIFLMNAIQDLFWDINLFSKCRALRVVYTQSSNLKLFVFLSVRNWELSLVYICAVPVLPCCISSSLDGPLGTMNLVYAGSAWTCLYVTSDFQIPVYSCEEVDLFSQNAVRTSCYLGFLPVI